MSEIALSERLAGAVCGGTWSAMPSASHTSSGLPDRPVVKFGASGAHQVSKPSPGSAVWRGRCSTLEAVRRPTGQPRFSENLVMVDPSADTRTFSRSVVAVVEGDITRVAADAIVNAANSAFAAGGGVDGAIRRAAGPELSGEMRRRYPAGMPTGSAVATGAYALPARWVIHAVGPVWGFGGQDKLDLLASAYRSALQVADELGARLICAPAISAGTFGFPLETAADVALRTVGDYLLGDTGIERVTFVLRPNAVDTFRRRLAAI